MGCLEAFRFRVTAATLLITLAGGAAGDEALPGSGAVWALSGGGDYDTDGGYSVDGGVALLPNDKALIAVTFGQADASTDVSAYESTFASLLADYSFGPIGVSASAGWSSDDGFVDRFRYGASLYAKAGSFRLEFGLEDWRSDFDTIRFDALVNLMPPTIATIAVDCEVDNTAASGRLSFTGERFGAYASAKTFNYSTPDCDFAGAQNIRRFDNLSGLADVAPDVFRLLTIGATAATRLAIRNTTSSLLDRSLSAGVSLREGDVQFGLDYYFSEEVIQGLEATTVSGRVLFPVGQTVDLELRLGIANGDQVDSIGFGGLSVFWYLPTSR